jgi:tetratricopeptide (TPR) repeat protein
MKALQVFLSHTSDVARFPEDRPFVQAALDAVGRARMAPVDMRYFAARDGLPADYCRQQVQSCDIYVAIVGFRYGSIVEGEGVSYTESEFLAATAAGLPRLVFLLADDARPPGATDKDLRLVRGFRKRLREASLLVREFKSSASLELEVFHALSELANQVPAISGSRAGFPAPEEETLPAADSKPGIFTVPPTGPQVPATAEVRYSLPPDTAVFTGREEELSQIIAAATDPAEATGMVAIRAIGGMPGVGKTALAVHAAYALRNRFPDRQLYVNLHAHTPGREPLLPKDALAGLLAAVGVDPRYLPGDLDGRAGLWRDRMAGQRALLVLDNAASSDQVTPLLPGTGDCMVFVTSRRHLGDLPGAVTYVLLDALTPQQAQEMFIRLAPRAVHSPGDAAEVVALAGYLPLPISLLARLFARHPSWTLADLAAETRADLLTLTAENSSVAAAFEVSYRHLDPARQRFFRLLGLHPGTTTDSYAAAALAGTSPAEAASLLDRLYGEGLLTEAGRRRYGMHDLLRRYARDRAAADPPTDNRAALDRLLGYYEHAAARAGARLSRTRPRADSANGAAAYAAPAMEDAGQALGWIRAERANLLACLAYATEAGQRSRVVALTAALATVWRRDGPWADAITRHTTAIQAARTAGDRLGEANALLDLAEVRWLRGDYPDAVQVTQQALDMYRVLGNRLGEANALDNIGVTRRLTGDYLGAAQVLEQALDMYRDLGERLGEANALDNIGIVQWLTGDYQNAAQAFETALRIYRDLGDRFGEAGALAGLGIVQRLTADYQSAARTQEQALSIYRELADRSGEAFALNNLGVVWQLTGEYQKAIEALERVLIISRALGDRGGETETLNERGTLYRVCGQFTEAEDCHRQALGIARAIASSWDEGQALAGLGRCAVATGRTAQGVDLLRKAHEIFKRIGAADAQAILDELNAATGPASTG